MKVWVNHPPNSKRKQGKHHVDRLPRRSVLLYKIHTEFAHHKIKNHSEMDKTTTHTCSEQRKLPTTQQFDAFVEWTSGCSPLRLSATPLAVSRKYKKKKSLDEIVKDVRGLLDAYRGF